MKDLRKATKKLLSGVLALSMGLECLGVLPVSASDANPEGLEYPTQMQFTSLPEGVEWNSYQNYFVFTDSGMDTVDLDGSIFTWAEPVSKSLDDLEPGGVFDASKVTFECTNPGVSIDVGELSRDYLSAPVGGGVEKFDGVFGDVSLHVDIEDLSMREEVIKVLYDGDLMSTLRFTTIPSNEKVWAREAPIYCNGERIFGLDDSGSVVKKTELTRSSTGEYEFLCGLPSQFCGPVISVNGTAKTMLSDGTKHLMTQPANDTVTFDIDFRVGGRSSTGAGLKVLGSVLSCKAADGQAPAPGDAGINRVMLNNTAAMEWDSDNTLSVEVPLNGNEDVRVLIEPSTRHLAVGMRATTQNIQPVITHMGDVRAYNYVLRNRKPGDQDTLYITAKGTAGYDYKQTEYTVNVSYVDSGEEPKQVQFEGSSDIAQIVSIRSKNGELTKDESGKGYTLVYDRDYNLADLEVISTEPLTLVSVDSDWGSQGYVEIYPTSCYQMPDGNWYSMYDFDGADLSFEDVASLTMRSYESEDLFSLTVKYGNESDADTEIALKDITVKSGDDFSPKYNKNVMPIFNATDSNNDGKVVLDITFNSAKSDIKVYEGGNEVTASSQTTDGSGNVVSSFDIAVSPRQSRKFEVVGEDGSYAIVSCSGYSAGDPSDVQPGDTDVVQSIAAGEGDELTPAFSHDVLKYSAKDANNDGVVIITAEYKNGNITGSAGVSIIDPMYLSESTGVKTWAIDEGIAWDKGFTITATDGKVYQIDLVNGDGEVNPGGDDSDSSDSSDDSSEGSGSSSEGSGSSSEGSGSSSEDSGENPDDNFEIGHIYSITCIEGSMTANANKSLYTMFNEVDTEVVFEIESLGKIELRRPNGEVISPESETEGENARYTTRYRIMPTHTTDVAEKLDVYSAEASEVETRIRVALRSDSEDIGILGMYLHFPYDTFEPEFSKQNLIYEAKDVSSDGKVYLEVKFANTSLECLDANGNRVDHNGVEPTGEYVYLFNIGERETAYYTMKADATGEEYLLKIVGTDSKDPGTPPPSENVSGTDVVYIDTSNAGDLRSPDTLVVSTKADYEGNESLYHGFPMFLSDAHEYNLYAGELDDVAYLRVYGLDPDKMPSVMVNGKLETTPKGTECDASYVNSCLGTSYDKLYVSTVPVSVDEFGTMIKVGPSVASKEEFNALDKSKVYNIFGYRPALSAEGYPITDNTKAIYPISIDAMDGDYKNTRFDWGINRYIIEDSGDEHAKFSLDINRAEVYLIDTENKEVGVDSTRGEVVTKTPVFGGSDQTLPQTTHMECDIPIAKTALWPYLLVMRRPGDLRDTYIASGEYEGSFESKYYSSDLETITLGDVGLYGNGGSHTWEDLPYCDVKDGKVVWFYNYIVMQIQGANYDKPNPPKPPVPESDVTVTKTDADTGKAITAPATFVFFYEEGGKQFYYTEAGTFVADRNSAKVFSTVDGKFVVPKVPYGLYYISEVDAPTGYIKVTSPMKVLVATPDKGVEFENTKEPPKPPEKGDFKVVKVDKDTGSKITGSAAEFKLGKADERSSVWIQEDGSWGSEDSAKVFSTVNGEIVFKDLDFGTYYLKEVKAPDGYVLAVNTVSITNSLTSKEYRFSNTKEDEPEPPDPPKPNPPDEDIIGDAGEGDSTPDPDWPEYKPVDPEDPGDPSEPSEPDTGNSNWELGNGGITGNGDGNTGDGNTDDGTHHGQGNDNDWDGPKKDKDDSDDSDNSGNGEPENSEVLPVITPDDGNNNGGDNGIDYPNQGNDGPKNDNVTTGGFIPSEWNLGLVAVIALVAAAVGTVGFIGFRKFRR